jgi:hypothetical protein
MRFVAILLLTLFQGLAAAAAAVGDGESLVKASIVYNIARFVSWPETSGQDNAANLIICIQKDNQLAAAFSNLAAAQGANGGFQLRLIERFGVQNLECQVAFLSEEDLDHVDLSAMARDAILTVSDTAGFINDGGTIEIQRTGIKLGFSINRLIERLSSVSLSSQILQLAEKVI